MEKKRRKFSIVGILTLVIFTMFVSTASVNAVAEPKVFEHKLSVPTNKVWSIYLNDTLNSSVVSNIGNFIKVTTVNGIAQPIGFSYDANNKVINVNPPQGGYKPNTIYSLMVNSSLTNSIGSGLEENYVIDFTTQRSTNTVTVPQGSVVEYVDYSFTLDQFVQSQSGKLIMYNRNYPFTSHGSLANVKAFADAESLSLNSTQVYQFLSLKYIDGISADVLNKEINKYEGALKGKGSVFIEAGKTHNINPVYLNLHAALETGNGTSQLATGVDYKTPDGKTVKVYNMYGIGAIDSDPIGGGAKTAYENGWTTPDKAIIGGAKWIGDRYIHCSQTSSMADKDTLFEMRWAIGEYPSGWKQYATDVAWAYKQAINYEKILSQCPSAKLKFQIPRFAK